MNIMKLWFVFLLADMHHCTIVNQSYLTLIRYVVGLHAHHYSKVICSDFIINVLFEIADIFVDDEKTILYFFYFIPTVA